MDKKWLSFLLALVMILTAAVPALAAEAPPVAEDMPQTGAIAPMAEAPAADMAQDREVPLTFHGWSENIALHCDFIADGEEVTLLEDGSLQDTVLAGTDFSVVMAAGYGLEVLVGGTVTGSHAPDDPAFPNGTAYDVHVNEDAEYLELAAVCTGEGAPVQTEDAPSAEEIIPEAETPAEETIPEEEIPEIVPEVEPSVEEIEPETAPEAETTEIEPETQEEAPTPELAEAIDQPEETSAERPATGTFKDVPDDSWYKDVVEQAYASGMISGTSEDTFSPNAAASRGQTVAMLYREAGCPDVDAPVTFGDLTADYYKDAVKWAAAIGAVQGVSESQFAPNQAVTRQQLAAMLYRMAGQPGIWAGGMMEDYTDAQSIAEYARGPMQWALDNGIIKGYGDRTMRPNATATRAEVCAMLVRYNEVIALYPDDPVWWAGPGGNDKADETPAPTQPPAEPDYPPYAVPGVPDQPEKDPVWCIKDAARLRSGPGESYEVIGTVNKKAAFERLCVTADGWTGVAMKNPHYGPASPDEYITAYILTSCLSETAPAVSPYPPGDPEALEKWRDETLDEFRQEMDKHNALEFVHEDYEPAVSGDTWTYAVRGGGTVTIRGASGAALHAVGTSGWVGEDTLTLSVETECGWGIKGGENYGVQTELAEDVDGQKCWVYYTVEMNLGEDIDLQVTSGEDAPRVLRVALKDDIGASHVSSGWSRFTIFAPGPEIRWDGTDFFTLKPGYKLKSLSPYITIGEVQGERHSFKLTKFPPAGEDVFWVEAVRA